MHAGAAFILSAGQQYEFHADRDLLQRHLPAMRRYVDYLSGKAKDRILDFGLGDWDDIGPKPPESAQLTPPCGLTATVFNFTCAETLARIADLLGATDVATTYHALAADLNLAFHRKFLDPATGQCASGSQDANAVPLVLPAARAGDLAGLVADVQKKGLTAGDVE